MSEEFEPNSYPENFGEGDEQLERLDSTLKSLGSGTSILIKRLQPSWCAGVLEEHYLADDQLDLDYLIRTWGGKVLSLRIRNSGGRLLGSYTVPLNSYPPLLWGRPIKNENIGDVFAGANDAVQAPSAPPVVVSNSAPSFSFEKLITALPAVVPLITKMMDGQEARRQQDMAMMMQIMNSRNSGSGIGDIAKIGAVMTQLNDMFRSNNPSAGGEASEMEFMGQALDVVKMFLDKPKPPPTPVARISPAAQPIPAATPALAPKPGDGEQDHAGEEYDIAKRLSGMRPEEASSTIISALGLMSPDAQQAAMSNFIGEFSSFMGDNGAEIVDEEDENE